MLQPASYEWAFADDPTYRQLPQEEKQIVFLVSGPIRGDNVRVSMVTKSLGEKLSSGWKKFWTTDRLAPYSINLRYGPQVGEWTWPMFALVISLIATVIVLFVQKKITWQKIIVTLMSTLVIVFVIG